jgi:methionyl aminopeptidase
VEAALQAVDLAAARMRPGVRWSEVAAAVVAFARERGFGVACGLAGHGVGRTLHEGPTLAMFADEAPETDFELEAGMTLCVEPVLTHLEGWNPTDGPANGARGGYPSVSPGRSPTRLLPDGWTVATVDRALACCHERTIGVGPDGGVTLTAA